MVEKMSRRTFMKSVGAVALAVAAASALSGCNGAPAVTIKPTMTYNSILYKDQAMTTIYATKTNMEFEVKNSGKQDAVISKDCFTMELDGKSVKVDNMSYKDSTGYHMKPEVTVKKGDTITLRVDHVLDIKDKDEFLKWNKQSHKLKVTIKYDGQKLVYTGDTSTRKVQ